MNWKVNLSIKKYCKGMPIIKKVIKIFRSMSLANVRLNVLIGGC